MADVPTTQYGVKYPSGKIAWIQDGMSSVPGSYGKPDASTATGRGLILDNWRQAVAGLELDPDTVPKPTFVSRVITKSYSTPTDVID